MNDPLNLHNPPDIDHALQGILVAGGGGAAKWHSRADRSATMVKEHHLWERIGLKPWTNDGDVGEWYKKNVESPANALIAADRAGAYHLTDRSTLLRQTAKQTITKTTVFFEPCIDDDVLLNSCWACRASEAATPEIKQQVDCFLDWLLGDQGQSVVETFGQQEAGLPFFAKVTDGFCKQLLKGGRPLDGRWLQDK